jgi:hypothetical protein
MLWIDSKPKGACSGIFGLNNQPVNFSTLGNHSSLSFITTLKDNGVIPSLSWSYTAGAKYRKCTIHHKLAMDSFLITCLSQDRPQTGLRTAHFLGV